MNKDKQIEEMANILSECKSIPDEVCDKHLKCAECKASRCYDAGYRKASEVAREIFEEIEKEIEEALKSNYKVLLQFENSNELYNSVRGKIDALLGIKRFIAELKKKYLEDKNNGN